MARELRDRMLGDIAETGLLYVDDDGESHGHTRWHITTVYGTYLKPTLNEAVLAAWEGKP